MTHPLVNTLAASPGIETVDAATLDSFLTAHTDCLTLLFFPGHKANKLETPDVAVVLIELLKQFGNSIRIGIIDAEDERTLMPQCNVLVLPSISVFHGSNHLKTIAKIQDWEIYMRDLPALMAEAGLTD